MVGVSLVVVVMLVVGVPAAGSAQPGDRARVTTSIGPALAFDAPIDGKGGIENPVAWCSDSSDPRTVWTLTNVGTGWSATYRWRGTLPGMYFPRVPVGVYRSETTAWCHGVSKSRTQRLSVVEKTLAGTVSRAEWRRIHRGMTRDQVAHVVGNNGRSPSRWAGKVSVIYDMMRFWAWSTVSYRHGRVVAKYWNPGHD